MKKKRKPARETRRTKPGRPLRPECDEDEDLNDEDVLEDRNEDLEDDDEGEDQDLDRGDDADEDEDQDEDEPVRRKSRTRPAKSARKSRGDDSEDEESEDDDLDGSDEDLDDAEEDEDPDEDEDDEDDEEDEEAPNAQDEEDEDDKEPVRRRSGAARPSGKSGSAAPSKKSGVDLPPDLQPGGMAEKVLQRNAKAARKQKQAADLLENLEYDLRCMREHDRLSSASSRLSRSDKREAYSQVLCTIKYDGDREDKRYRVFRYCLAHHAGLKAEEDLWDDALMTYVAHRRAFDIVLGGFVPEELRVRATEVAYQNGLNPTAASDWSYFQEHLLSAQQPEVGLQTGLKPLDEATGGLRGTSLIAGPTGSGKTTLALELALGALEQNEDVGVLFLTLEMPRHRIFEKLRSHEAGIDFRTLKSGHLSAEQHKSLATAEARLTTVLRRVSFVERVDGLHRKWHQAQDVLSVMKAYFNKLVRAAGVRRCLIIVDSLQRLPVEDPVVGYTEKGLPQQQTLSELEAEEERLRMLLEFQRWTCSPDLPDGSPVLALSRVTKGVLGHRLTLNDVPGRAGQVHDVDAVFLIEPDAQAVISSPTVTPTLLNVAKVRDGGLRGDIHLGFHFTVSRFREAAGIPRTGTGRMPSATSPASRTTARRSAGKSLE